MLRLLLLPPFVLAVVFFCRGNEEEGNEFSRNISLGHHHGNEKGLLETTTTRR